MATYGTFVDGTTLKASELNDFLTSITITPVISQPSTLNGTRAGRYFKVNKFVFYQFYQAFSVSGTANNAIQVDLPVTAATNSVRLIGSGYYYVASTDIIPISIIRTSTTKASFLTDLSTSLSTFLGQTGGPTLTVASGDAISGCVYYEAA